jgi:hypothetical protein
MTGKRTGRDTDEPTIGDLIASLSPAERAELRAKMPKITSNPYLDHWLAILYLRNHSAQEAAQEKIDRARKSPVWGGEAIDEFLELAVGPEGWLPQLAEYIERLQAWQAEQREKRPTPIRRGR